MHLKMAQLCDNHFFLMFRQKQSTQQIGALFLLIIAAVLLSIGEGSSKGSSGSNPDQILFHGIVPVLVASVLSGLASALCQWASQVIKYFSSLVWIPMVLQLWQFSSLHSFVFLLQVKKHTSYMMTIEMSVVGSLCLLASTYKSPDGKAIRQHGFFYGWTPLTLVIFFLDIWKLILSMIKRLPIALTIMKMLDDLSVKATPTPGVKTTMTIS